MGWKGMNGAFLSSTCLLVSAAPGMSSPMYLVVSPLPQALLWTDGRYHLQAKQELDQGWTLMKAGNPSVPTIKEFLSTRLSPASRVGIDPFVHSATFVNDLKEVSGN